jgi:hypothetical protein
MVYPSMAGRSGMFFSWTEGYLTGWNMGLPQASQEHAELSSMPRSEQMEFLRKWCEANPSKRYLEGATDLVCTENLIRVDPVMESPKLVE